jgi:hypothetical protein
MHQPAAPPRKIGNSNTSTPGRCTSVTVADDPAHPYTASTHVQAIIASIHAATRDPQSTATNLTALSR